MWFHPGFIPGSLQEFLSGVSGISPKDHPGISSRDSTGVIPGISCRTPPKMSLGVFHIFFCRSCTRVFMWSFFSSSSKNSLQLFPTISTGVSSEIFLKGSRGISLEEILPRFLFEEFLWCYFWDVSQSSSEFILRFPQDFFEGFGGVSFWVFWKSYCCSFSQFLSYVFPAFSSGVPAVILLRLVLEISQRLPMPSSDISFPNLFRKLY